MQHGMAGDGKRPRFQRSWAEKRSSQTEHLPDEDEIQYIPAFSTSFERPFWHTSRLSVRPGCPFQNPAMVLQPESVPAAQHPDGSDVLQRLIPWVPAAVLWAVVIIGMGVLIYRYRSKEHGQKTTEFLASATMGMALVMAALMAGSISQFYTDAITARFPLSHAGSSPGWAAQAFWLSVVLTVFIGLSYYAATGRQRRQEMNTLRTDSENLQKHTTELVDTLRTLPPEGFMRDFPRLCSAMMAAYSAAMLEETEEAARRAIRVALRTAAAMARSFDRGGRDERYSANVMRFSARDDLPPLAQWTDDEWALYPSGFRPERIEGALILDPDLASYADTDTQVPDLLPIRIVIPDPPRDAPVGSHAEGPLRMVPGCALAYYLARAYNAKDTWKIRESAEAEALSLSEAVIAETERYFRAGPGRAVRSFISLPLYESPGEMAGARVGVLNVESSEPAIFGGDDEKVRQFALAIAPVHFVIVSLLANLSESFELTAP
jgi:hypothetical protein